MTKNVTKEHINTVMEALPDEMETNEISALLMTVVSAYLEEAPKEAVSLLLSTTVIYARSIGMPIEVIAKILHSAADNVTKNPTPGRAH